MEFTFEESLWEKSLNALQPGDSINVLDLLPLLEEEDEEGVLEALDELAQKGITLSVKDLPELSVGSELALRLRQEAQLLEKGALLTGLEANDPLRLYLEELAAMPATGDLELLAARYLGGDEKASEKLVTLSLSRVVELASEFAGKNVLLLDLIQEGSMGLWQSILCYTGGDFASHRDWWIRESLARAVFLQARSGDLGQKLRTGMEDYRDMDQKLLGELGRIPTLEEIAEAMHVSLEEAAVYANMLAMARSRRRVDDAMEEKEPEMEEEQAVEDTAYFQMRQRILELLSTLPEADAKLLTLRYGLEGGLPLSPEDVGKKLGMTPQEVVEREANALASLRRQG